MFGSFFDFNRDGESDAFEVALGLSIVLGPDDNNDTGDCFDDEEGDDLLGVASHEDLEDELEALEDQLSDLQEILSDLEDEEPDDCTSAAYDRWGRRRDRLEEQIAELENQISEVEDQMEEY